MPSGIGFASRSSSFNGASASLPRIGMREHVEAIVYALLQRGLGIAAEDRAVS